MLQKKICMVGAFATGKTSLVAKFVYSIFSEKKKQSEDINFYRYGLYTIIDCTVHVYFFRAFVR